MRNKSPGKFCRFAGKKGVWIWLRAQEPQGLPRLGEEVEALILGHPHAGLVPVAKLVVLPDLDVIRRAISVPQPAADKEVEAPPDVTRPEQAQLQATAACERGRDRSQTVEPVVEEGPANGAALPRTPRVRRLDARARRMRWPSASCPVNMRNTA